MEFLDQVHKKYVVVAAKKKAEKESVKIPSPSALVYKSHFKLPKYNGLATIFTPSLGTTAAAKILISLFPSWSKEDHLRAAAKFSRMETKYDEKWAEAQKAAHNKKFGKDPQFADYKVSGIGRDEYAEDDKKVLRKLAHSKSKASILAWAHKAAAKMVGRIKVLLVSEEAKKAKAQASTSLVVADGYFNRVLDSYLETMMWADGRDPDTDEELEGDFSDELLKDSEADVKKFLKMVDDQGIDLTKYKTSRIGHDFWLTRNGHGAGFWDGDYEDEDGKALTKISKSFGEKSPYLGDDGLIYLG
jgi:hypothetical protein